MNSIGDYTYTISGDVCTSSSTISLIESELGIIDTTYLCYSHNLNTYLSSEYPSDGNWYDPEGNELPDGTLDFETNVPGLYQYQFFGISGCLMTLEINVLNSFITMVPASTTYCGSEDFCPFAVLQSLQPAGGENATQVGNWIVFSDNGNYLDFFMPSDICLSSETILSYGSNLVFTYVLGGAQCAPSLIDLSVTIDIPITEQVFECVPLEVIDLTTYLPFDTDSGGAWTDSNGALTFSMVDFNTSDPGSVHTYFYTYMVESGCTATFSIEFTINSLGAGSDQTINLCATCDEVYLYSLLDSSTSNTGSFDTANPYIIAETFNSGEYIYTVTDSTCDNQTTATYTINFIEEISSEVESICNSDGITFNAYLELSGGVPPYLVNGEIITGASIELLNLPVSPNGQTIILEDSGPCGTEQINVSVDDSDGDGVCDSQEIVGCMDPVDTIPRSSATKVIVEELVQSSPETV